MLTPHSVAKPSFISLLNNSVLFMTIFSLFLLFLYHTLLYYYCQSFVHLSTAFVKLVHKLVKVWFLNI